MKIYLITNLINNKQYVGQTTGKLSKRISAHFRLNKSAISNSIHKYGKENFKIEVLEETECLDTLNYLENYYIKQLNTMAPFGYNLHTGGNNHIASEQTRLKISKSKKGKPNSKLKNVKKSEEHKQKLRIAKLGKKQTKEHAKNAAITRIGKRFKTIIAFNDKESITIVGIKNVKNYGFDRARVHTCLKDPNIKHKNYYFKYVKEV